MPSNLALFVTTVALLAMLPGANNASITRQTLVAGRRAGLLTVAGSSTGILIWATAAAVGLSAVLLANPKAYLALRIGGAAVLLVLGLQSLRALRRRPSAKAASTADRHQAAAGRGSFVVGVATSLGNPKAGVVAVSLIPQFVTAHGPVLASSIALGAVWALISGTWFCLYVWTIDKGRARMTKPALQRLMHAATGLTLVGLGIAVAVGG
jgi:threonine/homoserine/homoserine lactone efflux protein